MFEIHLNLGKSSSFKLFYGIWSCFEKLKIKKVHACYVLESFIKFKLKLCTIDMLLGHDFLKWSLIHVVLRVFICFLKFWPRKIKFDALKVEFELEDQI